MENTQEKVSKILEIKENSDSIEIGSPSKGGAIKIYGDFSKPEVFRDKINNAKEIRQYANAQLGMNL